MGHLVAAKASLKGHREQRPEDKKSEHQQYFHRCSGWSLDRHHPSILSHPNILKLFGIQGT